MLTVLKLNQQEHRIGPGLPTTVIGERINPTNRKAFVEELERGDFETVRRDALAQKEAGAQVLDVNVGTGSVDEVRILPKAIEVAVQAAGLPICIDSSNAEAMEAALKVYPGKALVNSVTGEENSLGKILPMVKEYGAAVIGLTLDDDGIPSDVEKRVEIARKIIERSVEIGIPKEDVIIDPLTMSVATDSKAGAVTLEAVHRIATELEVNVVLGASNVSFGLPDRSTINAAFLAMAISAGVTAVISDPTNVVLTKAILAADVLAGKDDFAQRYIQNYRARKQ